MSSSIELGCRWLSGARPFAAGLVGAAGLSVLLGGVALLAACGPDDKGTGTTPVLPAPSTVSLPLDNPSTPDKIALGRLLFWDPILSGGRDVACATCHHPDFAYTDGAKVSVGAGGSGLGPARVVGSGAPHRTTRNAMTVIDTGFNGRTLDSPDLDAALAPMFWDSRAHSLEEQAKGPITTLDEMRGPGFDATSIFPEIVARLTAIPEYALRFSSAFAADPTSGSAVTEANVLRAVATFERTIVDTGVSFDRYEAGDASALTAQQKRGLATFIRSGCSACHSGPMFSDFKLHLLGNGGGRGAVARVPDVGAGNGTFRTGSLRNVARTAPYMHDGAFATLDEVFDFYQRTDDNGDPLLRALRVPDGSDRADVIAFFGALSDGTYDRTVPDSVPSGLPVGGNIRP